MLSPKRNDATNTTSYVVNDYRVFCENPKVKIGEIT